MTAIDTLWYTRCPVPTPLGIAVQLGWFAEEFGPDGIGLNSLQETLDPAVRESHFDHSLPHSFRQGGNIPAIWARANGRATRVIGLSWTDEYQAILALRGSGVARARDLKGRRVGIPVNPVSIDFNRASALRGFDKALELDGLTLGDVERVDTVLAPDEASGAVAGRGMALRRQAYRAEAEALASGAVDAIYVKGALGVETAERLGATVVAQIGFHPDPKVRINNGTPRTLTVDAALIDARPDLVARFLSRVVAAGEWARSHPEETIAYIAREAGSSVSAARAAYGADAHLRLGTFLTDDAIAALGDFKDFLFAHGFLATDFDLSGWIDRRPADLLAAPARDVA